MTQTKTWWFLETDDGEWLENEPHGTLTRDPNRALKWPNQTAADDFRRHLRHPWWGLKAIEHAWIEPAPHNFSDLEDDIADAISDSIDMDWSSRDGAKAVVRYLNSMENPGRSPDLLTEVTRLREENAQALKALDGLTRLGELVTEFCDPSGVLDVTGLKNRIVALEEVNAGLLEALKKAESVLALVEQPRGKDRDHGPEVTEIGRRIGFGALMSSAQASWREYATEIGLAGSEFVAGPCYSTVLSTLNMIRAALRAAEEASK